LCRLAGTVTAAIPSYRRLIPCQIDDLEAMERLGNRLGAYSGIERPVGLIVGERSTVFLKQTVAAVAGATPGAELLVLLRRGHAGHVSETPSSWRDSSSPFADKVLS
jgi:pimeloyl-ACP methyl ester carboxylesterase